MKDKETQLSTERLKFEYEKEDLQKQLTEQKEQMYEAKLDVGKVQMEMDKVMEEQEVEKNKLKSEMANLRDELVRPYCNSVYINFYSKCHVLMYINMLVSVLSSTSL